MYDGVTRILLPIDARDRAVTMSSAALELAQQHRAVLHILSIVDVDPSIERDVLYELFEATSRPLVDEIIAHTAQADISMIAVSIAAGAPVRVIQQYTTDHEIDRIVVRVHDRTGSDQLFTRYVVNEVIRQAGVPVHIVPTQLEWTRESENGDARH